MEKVWHSHISLLKLEYLKLPKNYLFSVEHSRMLQYDVY